MRVIRVIRVMMRVIRVRVMMGCDQEGSVHEKWMRIVKKHRLNL